MERAISGTLEWGEAMRGEPSESERGEDHSTDGIEQYRSYLLVLAQVHLAEQNRRMVDASDIVQKCLLEAHEHRDDFRGDPEAIGAWLRQILVNHVRDAYRFQRRQKRDVRREVSLDEGMSRTTQRLATALAGSVSSPSHQAIRHEEMLQLADAILELPHEQREAVTLHHLQEWSLRDIAAYLEKSEAAVAGLLFRGLRTLRQRLTGGEDSASDD